MTSSRALIEFYEGRRTDFAGRSIEDVWRMSHRELEDAHDYIQWLFPLREASAFQPDAPILDDTTIRAFDNANLRARLERSARVMADFYGFAADDAGGKPVLRRAPHFEQRRRQWATAGNHNLLRLTRIMTSLRILGLPDLATAWFNALNAVYLEHRSAIGAETMRYWKAGAGESDPSLRSG